VQGKRFVFLPATGIRGGASPCPFDFSFRQTVRGGDADHFVQTPHGRPPLITLPSGGERASVLELPVADA